MSKDNSPVPSTESVTLSFGTVMTKKVLKFALDFFPQCDSQFWGETLKFGKSAGTLAFSFPGMYLCGLTGLLVLKLCFFSPYSLSGTLVRIHSVKIIKIKRSMY